MVEPGEMLPRSSEPFDGMVVNAIIPFQWKDDGFGRGWVSVRDGFIDDAEPGILRVMQGRRTVFFWMRMADTFFPV